MDKIALIKKLREETMLGISDCKNALEESDYDYSRAFTFLREKGKASASKKSLRSTTSGLVGVQEDSSGIAIVELACETDFVAIGDLFLGLLRNVLEIVLKVRTNNLDELLSANGSELEQKITDSIAKIGENIKLKKVIYESSKGVKFGTYVHNANQKEPLFGQIVSLVIYKSTGGDMSNIIKKIAMHAAATSPQCVSVEQLSKSVVDEERRIYSEQARESGKPEKIIEKMIEGRLARFYSEAVLLEQPFVLDQGVKVGDFVKHEADKAGSVITIKNVHIVKLGA